MSVRKISSTVEIAHVWYSRDANGCLLWFAGVKRKDLPPDSEAKGSIRITIGHNTYLTQHEYSREEFAAFDRHESIAKHLITVEGKGALVRFEENWYWADMDLSIDDVGALLKAKKLRKQQTVQRAKSIASLEQPPSAGVRRGAIPEDLKLLVWERDRGTCTKCGSRTELQFDHIIPVALGGATSEANLQVLCGGCNRAKGSSIV